MVQRLSKRDARRIAVRAQLLSQPRPDDVLDVVRHLTLVQLEPTAAIAPSADVVMWSRLGDGYRRGELLERAGAGDLVELRARLRPAEDIALYRAEMEQWPGTGDLTEWQVDRQNWLTTNDECRQEILQRLFDEGPIPARALPDLTLAPWRSSGWNDDRNVRMLLELMVARGEVARAGYDGRTPLWDLAERVYPDVPPVPAEEARRVRGQRLLRALGICRTRAVDLLDESERVAVGEEVEVDGVSGTWQVDPAQLGQRFRGRTALLSPLDRLVFDRRRVAELFDFEYQLEMYKPAAKRRWGYWAMPILHLDRLVGKLDARADHRARVLHVSAVHEDVAFSTTQRRAVDVEIAALAEWLGYALDDQRGGR